MNIQSIFIAIALAHRVNITFDIQSTQRTLKKYTRCAHLLQDTLRRILCAPCTICLGVQQGACAQTVVAGCAARSHLRMFQQKLTWCCLNYCSPSNKLILIISICTILFARSTRNTFSSAHKTFKRFN